MLRFHEADNGHIRFDDQPIGRYNGEDIRQRLAVAAPQTRLFNTALRENLLLANPQAEKHAIEQACSAVSIHDFICAQPLAYDTLTGETGVRLSGGQAGALLKPAPVANPPASHTTEQAPLWRPPHHAPTQTPASATIC